MATERKEENMRLPIVGYAGHRKGERAENMFAKNYRETTMQTHKVLRATLTKPSAVAHKPPPDAAL